MPDNNEDELLRAVALQNTAAIHAARRRAEEELVAAKEALRESEQRLRATFSQAAVGIGIASLDFRFVEVNLKFAELLGYTPEEMRNLSATDITHADDLALFPADAQQLLSGQISAYTRERRYVRKDGATIWSQTTVTMLKDPEGQPAQFIAVIEDISQRKQAEEALKHLYEMSLKASEERKLLLDSERAAREEAERMGRLKDEFLATLSHELRTPLSAILGWAQILQRRHAGDAEFRQGLETIQRNARMQTQLIDDLLDMSRITSGSIRLDIQPVAPIAFIEAAIETVKPAAEAKAITLTKLLDPRAGPVSGDPARLQQVVWNLLSNAVKFTDKGGKIEVLLQRVNSHIEICVADNGLGIQPEFLAHIFERFRQADASSTRTHGGLGLGLSIVKQLVELHGGTVQALSKGEGTGTTVTVRLPVTIAQWTAPEARVHPAATARESVERRFADLSGVKVLMVDDEADARELMRVILTECGAAVVTAASAAEALTLLARERPDVILTDIGMPDADGYELLRRVREFGTKRGRNVPAIALTAFASSVDRTRALRSGFVAHVSKPVEPQELVATIASVAGRTAVRAG